jgi:hypothetical protein
VFEVGGVAYRWEPLCALRDALPAAFRKAPRRPPPSTPGLYRLRRVGRTELDYIGQTRLWRDDAAQASSDACVDHGEVMPFRDPHTAAPALWALLQREACDFEVSVIALPAVDDRWRRGLEVVAILSAVGSHCDDAPLTPCDPDWSISSRAPIVGQPFPPGPVIGA